MGKKSRMNNAASIYEEATKQGIRISQTGSNIGEEIAESLCAPGTGESILVGAVALCRAFTLLRELGKRVDIDVQMTYDTFEPLFKKQAVEMFDLAAYELSYSKGATTIGGTAYDGVVGFTEVTGTLEAMKPYVLIPKGDIQPFSAGKSTIVKTYDAATKKFVTMPSTTSQAVSGQTVYAMTGTMAYMEGSADYYIMQSGNVWKKCATGSYPGPCMLPMRSYLKATASPSRVLTEFTDSNGSTTIIRNLQTDPDAAPVIYDLQGRRVKNPQKGGLYIINGRKTLVN